MPAPRDALYRRRRNPDPVTCVDGLCCVFRPASIFATMADCSTGVVSDMRTKILGLSMFFAALLALSACSPFTILNATIGEDGFRVQSGIRFGPEVRHALDV